MSNPPTPNNPAPYTKFGFDTEFFELVQGQQGTSVSTGVPASPTQQKAQIEEARQQGYGDGYAAGVIEGQNQAQADLAQLQQHLQNTLLSLQHVQTQREEQLVMQMLSLLRVSLHNLVGHAVANYGPELLEHHMRALLPMLATDEALTLKIHPAARGFHEKLRLPQAAIMGMAMHIATDPNLGQTDAVVQWTNGGVESKLAQHLEAVDALLAGAGAHMLPVEQRTHMNVAAQPVMEAPQAVVAPTIASQPAPAMPADMETEAEKAARARANALLGDDDDDLVDALK